MTEEQITTIITTLEQNLGAGVARVKFNGREVEYAGPQEIQRAITYFKSLLADAEGTQPVKNIRLFSKRGY